MGFKDGLRQGFTKDPVLYVSLILAVLSMLLVPPSADYADYVDVRTLVLLLCLMVVVAGMASTGVFDHLARRLLSCSGGVLSLSAVLVGLPFFLSMFITNDVSLLTFVPFAVLVLDMAGRRDLIIPVTVLQTVAANLGSMLLPFGNPQNIFIASKYDVGLLDFLSTTGPYVAVGSAVLLFFMTRIRGTVGDVSFENSGENVDARRLSLFLILFVICIVSVLRIMPYWIALAVVAVVVLAVSPKTVLSVDWGLLLTFVFLFVFAGNIASVDVVRETLDSLMSDGTILCTAAVSQAISNVPATIMLSNFTEDWSGLLSGANIGGFGTPIASMASIITLRIYSKESDADRIGFLKNFTLVNVVMLVVLLALSSMI